MPTDLTVAGLLSESLPCISGDASRALEMTAPGVSDLWARSAGESSQMPQAYEFPLPQTLDNKDVPTWDDYICHAASDETLSEPWTPSFAEKTPDIAAFENEEDEPQQTLKASCSLSVSIASSPYSQHKLEFNGPIFPNQETTVTHEDLTVVVVWKPGSKPRARDDWVAREPSRGRSGTRNNAAKGTRRRKSKDSKQGKCRPRLMPNPVVTMCKDRNIKSPVLPASGSGLQQRHFPRGFQIPKWREGRKGDRAV